MTTITERPMNYRFDIDEWLARFPLKDSYGRYSADIITSPCHICQNEQLRREMRDQFDWGVPVPVDVFVMADGEPADRFVTKIGGLPYRAASAEWPIGPTGTPLAFLGQVNFADSKDLTGELPGDVLLIFADNVSVPRYLGLEWQDLGLTGLTQPKGIPHSPTIVDPASRLFQQKLLEQIKLPMKISGLGFEFTIPGVRGATGLNSEIFREPTNALVPCYGHIFRTTSFPQATPREEASTKAMCRGKEVSQEYLLTRYQATQIGAAPFFIQLGDAEMLPGRILCTVNSVGPEVHKPYPWINHPEPLLPESEWRFDREFLMLGDTGCIYISIDDAGELHWHWSSY